MSQDERTISLRGILRKFLAEDLLSHKAWPGMEFGNMILGAMEGAGLDRKRELEEALAYAKRTLGMRQ